MHVYFFDVLYVKMQFLNWQIRFKIKYEDQPEFVKIEIQNIFQLKIKTLLFII